MATSLPRWTVPVVVGVLLLALAATSLVLWLVKGESAGPVDATEEMAFACGIDRQLGDLHSGTMLGPESKTGADMIDDLGFELTLISAAGMHDQQYAVAGKSAQKAYQQALQYFNVDGFVDQRSAVTAPCSDVSAAVVPGDPTKRLGAYADFGCRLSALVRDADPQIKKMSTDSPVVGDIEALGTVGQSLRRFDDYASRGEKLADVQNALMTFDQKSLDQALAAAAKACG